MPHSLHGYLSRRTTEELEEILDAYINEEQTELNKEIIRLITEILAQRVK